MRKGYDAVVCGTVDTLPTPTPGSVQYPCRGCGVALWVSPSSRRIVLAGTPPLCLGCASAVAEQHGKGAG